MISIVIVDKDGADRQRVQEILSRQSDFNVIGSGKDGYDAIKLVEKFKPDIAIMDINLDVLKGPASVPILKSKSPKTAVIFLTSLDDETNICEAITSEVRGYLLKDADMDVLNKAVRLVYEGGRFISSKIESKIYHILASLLKNNRKTSSKPVRTIAPSLPPEISKKELLVLTCIGQGSSTKEIAKTLGLTTATVRNYISSLMHKIGLKHRIQLPIFAIEHGLVPAVSTNAENESEGKTGFNTKKNKK